MRSLPYDKIRRWTTPDGTYCCTTDRERFDVALAASHLANNSYWASDRTEAQEDAAVANSRCYVLLDVASDAMVGSARAVTDHVSFAWIADVFVVPEVRGRGLGKFLIACIVDDLAKVQRLFLGTRDAHGLYAQFGFVPTDRNERWMERLGPAARPSP